MQVPLVVTFSLVLLALTSTALLVFKDWRISILVLAVQYLGVFLVISQVWPFGLAIVKMIAGWISCSVLAIAGVNLFGMPPVRAMVPFDWFKGGRQPDASGGPPLSLGILFGLFAAGLVLIISISIAFQSSRLLGEDYLPVLVAGLILIGIGLLQVALYSDPFYISIGLLTIIPGFEILYAIFDSSTLVAGLLAGVNLGIALIGAYLMAAPLAEALE